MNQSEQEAKRVGTVELCAEQLRDGVRCILRRGHMGDHECHRGDIPLPIRWKR